MKRCVAATVLACVFIATGCESWPWQAQGQSNLVAMATDAQRIGYAPGWGTTIDVPRGQRIRFIAILDDLIVAIEEPQNFVTAVNLRDGQLRWRRLVGSPTDVLYGPTRYGDAVMVNTETTLFKINADTGDLVELQRLANAVRAAPVIIDDLAIFGGANGHIFAHQIISGLPRWQYKLNVLIGTSPVEVGVDAFAADVSGVYALVETDSGTLTWRGRTHGAVKGQPVANRFSILVPADDGSLYALERSTGRDQWIFRTAQPLRVAPVAIDAQVYVLLDEATVALDAQTGRELWRRQDRAKPVLRRGGELLLSGGNQLLVAELDSGRTLDSIPTAPLRTVLTGPDGSIILVSTRGDLQQFLPRR